ncbi:MAG: ZIP family metal transporter [Candidatus Zixiibacteriota bacterium]|nr:MAG: ZIP family metal transporter [candidate division Zixibacteria bacterium]
MPSSDILFYGAIASLLAGFATGIGALPVFFLKPDAVPRQLLNILLGLAAGVMLAATSFSLVVPSIEYGTEIYGSSLIGVAITCLFLFSGGWVLDLIDKSVPHLHRIMGREGPPSKMSRVGLFIMAITIHNFPEGMAVGVGFGAGDFGGGLALAIGIGIQNMPEGLAVALPLIRDGRSRSFAWLVALATGLVEPIGGLFGAGLVTLARTVLPAALAFAAGAMLFVISDEIIPETHRHGTQRSATYGVIVGFIIMMALDNLLG